MFLKISHSRGHFYLQLVHSYREKDKIKHKILANLGRFDSLVGNQQLIRLGERFLSIAQAKSARIWKIEEEERLIYGHVVYQRLFEKWNLAELIKGLMSKSRCSFDGPAALHLLLVDRLLSPQSKLKSFERQSRYYDTRQAIPLHVLYRCLDVLAAGKDEIEETLFSRRRDIFNYTLDVVFYDVTTFHFESVRADELKDFGFSKDNKVNEVQVVLGLLVDTYGIPVGFDLFPGHTYEGETILQALEKLKKRFAIGNVIIVSDKAMSSKTNFFQIRSASYDYIISMRLRSFSEEMQDMVLQEKGYQELEGVVSGRFKYKVIRDYVQEMKDDQGKKRQEKVNLVCFWSEKRAERDKAERERMLQKARDKVENGSSLSDRRGYRRYIKTKGKSEIDGIDDEQINEDARFDGYYVIETSRKLLEAQEVLSAYKRLWQIEESFKIMKSTLWTRPIFHWTPRRIKGHFVLCFLAFLLERTLENTLKNHQIDASPEKIREALNSLQISLLNIDDEKYYLKGKSNKLAGEILRTMRIKQPNNLSLIGEFKL